MPQVLNWLAWASLAIAALSLVVIAGDILFLRRQRMAVMNLVWPLTGLYFGPLAVWAYYAFGRAPQSADQQPGGEEQQDRKQRGSASPPRQPAPAGKKGGETPAAAPPNWRQIFVGTSHCGAGCTLGDILGAWLVLAAGWSIAGLSFWPEVLTSFALAFLIGVAFQYFAIAPMRHLKPRDGIIAALKADTLSITAFEVGMFVWMALVRFLFFPRGLHPTEPVYWLMMQIAMVIGFATSFPMNKWLIDQGLKEKM